MLLPSVLLWSASPRSRSVRKDVLTCSKFGVDIQDGRFAGLNSRPQHPEGAHRLEDHDRGRAPVSSRRWATVHQLTTTAPPHSLPAARDVRAGRERTVARNPWSSLRHTPRGPRGVLLAAVCGVLAAGPTISAQAVVPRSTLLRGEVHVWESQEITLQSAQALRQPLRGRRRAGSSSRARASRGACTASGTAARTFKVRFVATAPGEWRWRSGSNQPGDAGLNGGRGSCARSRGPRPRSSENPNRRGFVRATANGHALAVRRRHAVLPARRHVARGLDVAAAVAGRAGPRRTTCPGPGISFEEAVAYRKRQGFNSISFISAFPNWDADHHGATFANADGVFLRNAWEKFGHWAPDAAVTTADGATTTAKDMADEHGHRPFEVLADRDGLADFDRLNPAYFRSLDRKMRHLAEQGFVPVARDRAPRQLPVVEGVLRLRRVLRAATSST